MNLYLIYNKLGWFIICTIFSNNRVDIQFISSVGAAYIFVVFLHLSSISKFAI